MIKVFQVVECGGPGGTGEQVSAICNGLDPARFEVSLVYAVRGGSPDDYRTKCAGAKAAYFLPEMTREISPARDLAALRKLRELFVAHRPDVVHAHDWHAVLMAPMLKLLYKGKDAYFDSARTVLTVHNLAYQGVFSLQTLLKAGFSKADFTYDRLMHQGAKVSIGVESHSS